MDRLSAVMARLSLIWLLLGFVIGAAMLSDEVVPGNWRAWMSPSHGHILFVGWFLQFALGIAYWLLPRRRSPERPLGYDERIAFVAVAALNLGLILRVASEPWERVNRGNDLTLWLLALSSILQVGAAALFVAQLWPRVGPKMRSTQTMARRASGSQATSDRPNGASAGGTANTARSIAPATRKERIP